MAEKYKERKDGRFSTYVDTGKKSDDGSRIRIAVYGTSSRDLGHKVGEIRAGLKNGTYADDKGLTFRVYAEKWVLLYKESHTSIATFKKYKGILANHCAGIDNMKLRDIVKSDIQGLINVQSGHPDTQRMIKVTINQILESAIDDGLLYRNVCKNIKVATQDPQIERRPLTDAEKDAIKKCRDEFTPMQCFYIDTLFVSGLRPEEVLALGRFDVDPKNNSININKALSWKGGKHIKEPKSKAGYRTIGVPTWYIDEYKIYTSGFESAYLFHGVNKELISESTYKRMWKDVFKKINAKMGGTADIKATNLTPYLFRHNYATMLYYAGVDIKEAQRLLGHSNIRITLEIYTHLEAKKTTLNEKIESFAM